MRLDQLAENRILDAIEAGMLQDLPGEGIPLQIGATDYLANDLWLAHHILQNAELLPEWLELARTIEQDQEKLATLESRHASLVEKAQATGDWKRLTPMIAECRKSFATAAKELRGKQDRYNLEAPSLASERPAIWVDERLRLLDDRVREARAATES